MSGEIEFFNPNEVKSNCTFDFTTANEDNSAFLYDNDVLTTLSSDSSADGVNEKLKIEFASSRTVDFIGVFGRLIISKLFLYFRAARLGADELRLPGDQ